MFKHFSLDLIQTELGHVGNIYEIRSNKYIFNLYMFD